MTPRELAVCVDTYNRQQEQELEKLRRTSYLTALLTAQFVWAKGQRPSYEQVFGAPGRSRDMSDDEMLAVAEALNARFGGSDSRKGV